MAPSGTQKRARTSIEQQINSVKVHTTAGESLGTRELPGAREPPVGAASCSDLQESPYNSLLKGLALKLQWSPVRRSGVLKGRTVC